LKKISGQYSVV